MCNKISTFWLLSTLRHLLCPSLEKQRVIHQLHRSLFIPSAAAAATAAHLYIVFFPSHSITHPIHSLKIDTKDSSADKHTRSLTHTSDT